MAGLLARIAYGARSVARFSGRDTPGQFWPWAVFVFILSTIAGFAVMVPPMLNAMIRLFRAIEAAGPQPPGQPIPPALMEAFMADYAAQIGALALPLAAINLALVLLLAAGVVRRLHDCDRTGAWGLMPLPMMAVSVLNMPAGMALASGRRPTSPWEITVSMASALYWVAVLILIVLLVADGTRGPNRFGPDPRQAPSR